MRDILAHIGTYGKKLDFTRSQTMGMRTYWSGVTGRSGTTGGSYSSGGASAYPVTGFPKTAYLGNNRRYTAGGPQSQPSPMAGGVGQALNFDPRHALVFMVILIVAGVYLWHLDNR